MNDLPYHNITKFLSSIYDGFHPSLHQALLFLVLLGSLLIIFFSGYFVQNLAKKRKKREHVDRVFDRIVRNGSLTQEEETYKLERQPWSGTNRIHSTLELPLGLEIRIVQWEGKKLSGKIFYQRPDSIVVKADCAGTFLKPDMPVVVSFKHERGIYSFGSHIAYVDEEILGLDHAERLMHLQKRKFYRSKISKPVYVKIAHSDKPAFETTLIDLSGGGASIVNSNGSIHPGNMLVLELTLPPNERVTVPCEVVQLSHNSEIAHICFNSISNRLRERLVHYIFAITN
jgi:c-di-GMP-binding flagellar brake protein YcgR